MALKNGDKGKKSFIQKLFSTMERTGRKMTKGLFDSSGEDMLGKPNRVKTRYIKGVGVKGEKRQHHCTLVEILRIYSCFNLPMYCLFSTSLFDSYKSPTLRFLYAICKGAKSNLDIGNLFFCGEGPPMSNGQGVEPVRVFVATWNVGGKSPHSGLNLDDFLHVHDQADIYVLGFQEIVPLNAGNVLVVEDNEPAARWLQLINQSLNKSPAVYVFNSPTHPHDNRSVGLRGLKTTATTGGSLFFPKYSLKAFSQTFRTESGKRLKTCSCTSELERKYGKDCCFQCPKSSIRDDESSSEEDDEPNSFSTASSTKHMKYSLIACRQMVGIFVTIWMKKELVQHVSHLRISCISRGIMGCLGNKGCISVRMTFHQTSFCFICSHLASGEKEGDELRRNLDVIETLKNTQFPKICRTPASGVPEKILDHERVIWFGDLNYRIALSYSETRKLLEENAWDALLDKDQLKIEREAGRVFKGWQEGKIYFAPTYKYRNNSDTYAGDTTKSKTKRRTPAWCDRILWHGHGIRQLSYIRGESQFSDHRPVCATFLVDVNVPHSRAEML